MTHTKRPSRTRPRAAFTLIEMVVSLCVISIVFVAMGSVMVLATKVIHDPDDPVNLTIDAADVLRKMCSELEIATVMKTATATVVEFDVPDRDSDAVDEVIKYEWSGTAGDPLLRQYNGGNAVKVLESVVEFELIFNCETTHNTTPPEIEGAEELFLMQDNTNSGSGGQMSLKNDNTMAQVFKPTLPADASSWRITRVMAMPSPKKPFAETLSVSVRATDVNDEPLRDQMVDEVQRAESNLVNNSWQTFTFSNAGGLDPARPYAVVLSNATLAGTVATVKLGTGSLNSPNSKYYWTAGGNTWVEYPDYDLWLFVYGTVSVPDPNWTPSGGPLASVSITLNRSTEPATRRYGQVTTLNYPAMP